ncbi:hypothetical protein PPACK8108_LOCUS13622 [Phakopsora pachyrhizi]|uniref:Uncharacterized protein n=1 Tax=Phakopsora pachyrhizi TaxID=170000 RepID=A0AAV0B6X8_PHAPC|nr:hypothetical protein PPACK8108_LOCUS13622 [Phakopsora pachyrhizi]
MSWGLLLLMPFEAVQLEIGCCEAGFKEPMSLVGVQSPTATREALLDLLLCFHSALDIANSFILCLQFDYKEDHRLMSMESLSPFSTSPTPTTMISLTYDPRLTDNKLTMISWRSGEVSCIEAAY